MRALRITIWFDHSSQRSPSRAGSAFDSAFHLADYTERGDKHAAFFFLLLYVQLLLLSSFVREQCAGPKKVWKSWYTACCKHGCRGTDGDNHLDAHCLGFVREVALFFFLRATLLCCTFRFRCLRSFTIRRVSLCASTMCLYIASCASVHVFRNADVKATAGQWFVCTSPTVNFFFLSSFFLLSMRVSSIYLPHCLRRCVRMSSQVVCYSAPDVLDVLFDIGGVFWRWCQCLCCLVAHNTWLMVGVSSN